VLPSNSNPAYWKERGIPDGKYGWVEEELLRLGYFKKVRRARIGIPQGGALSGLIANIVLDYADHKVIKPKDQNLGYFRFCDDMIILHPKMETCFGSIEKYIYALTQLKLVPHEFEREDLTNTKDSFWSKKVKSKGPYKWSPNYHSDFPWIGFVGYEIHFTGHLRVRKSSLKKELQKQRNITNEVLKVIAHIEEIVSKMEPF